MTKNVDTKYQYFILDICFPCFRTTVQKYKPRYEISKDHSIEFRNKTISETMNCQNFLVSVETEISKLWTYISS